MDTPLYIDIETYSSVDLRKNSVYKYTQAHDFQILFAWYALGDGPIELALGHQAIANIPGLWQADTIKVAHNAAFERICFSALVAHEPGEYLSPEEWLDTMALAAEAGYPQKLAYLAKALGGELKDEAGTRLINLFCKPNRKGQRTLPEDKPEEWAQFLEYGRQDVATLRDVHQHLPHWPTDMERRVYVVDQHINDTGIPVDVEMATHAVAAADDNKMLDELGVMAITGVDNPGSNPQMLAWLQGQGVQVSNLQAATVQALLDQPEHDPKAFLTGESDVSPAQGISPTVRRVLELRQELALVAAKKYTAALERVSDDHRLRGSFAFFGAHTGRWAGRGVQLQNLPSATLGGKDDTPDQVEDAIAAGVLDLKLGLGASSHTLKALVRAMFTGPFTVVDYAAIEARVVAWLAGEQWALDAFADGRDIYVETAERMGGLTRKEGKVAVLALGYNGGVNSLRAMGAEGSDAKLQALVTQWRNANRNIVDLWAEMNEAFQQGDTSVGAHMYVTKDGADRYLQLPSGRAVGYHGLTRRFKDTAFGRRQVVSFLDPKTPGARVDTYGGRLVENVTQAVARDVLAEALVRLHDAGHEVVGHVHDEILVRGASPTSVDEVSAIMTESPAWAAGLPIAAEGFTCARYRKG